MAKETTLTALPIFPSILYHCEIPVPKDLINFSLNLAKKDEGLNHSNYGGWHSSYSLGTDKKFKEKYLDKVGESITQKIDVPYFSFNGCWLNVNGKGHFNKPHNHPTSDYALVWFIKTPENCGHLELQHPQAYTEGKIHNFFTQKDHDMYSTYPVMYLHPKEGHCFLFPSHIQHWVLPNESDEIRISMAANIIIHNK